MGFQLGALGADGSIDIAYTVTFGGDELHCTCQENFTVDILEFPCGIGEMVSYVAHMCSTQECVADGMDEYIGIRVTEESAVVLKANTS